MEAALFIAIESPVVGVNHNPRVIYLIGPTNVNVADIHGPFQNKELAVAFGQNLIDSGSKSNFLIKELIDG